MMQRIIGKLDSLDIADDANLKTQRKMLRMTLAHRALTECLMCGGKGHSQKQCPNRKLIYK